MAVGDFTITETSMGTSGPHRIISGTAEVNGDKTAFDIFPNGAVIAFQCQGTDDSSPVQVLLNQNASGTTDPGNVTLRSYRTKVHTCNWTATYIS